MKFAIASLLVLIMGSSTLASPVDPWDAMVLSFGSTYYERTVFAPMLSHLPVYIIYTWPEEPAVSGFECAVEVMGASNSLLSTTSFPMPSIDVGDKNPTRQTYNFIVGYSEPMVTQGLTVLATLDLFYLDTAPLALMLGESNPSSLDEGYPAILLPDGSERSVWIENCACVNQDCCGIETEETSFGTVKSLFR